MKKRILFVDDDPLVLQGLQRMLRSMREEWEMEFVESGPIALEAMAKSPFDVVVSDMRMPGMNGAELLNRVMKLHPNTIRFILSGHADQDLVMQCVGTTHQYLAKPCEPDALKATIRRASALGQSLQNGQLKSLVSRIERLPSLPSLYLKVVQKLQDPEVSVEEIAGVVSQDMGMTAQILKLVNSAFFGLEQHLSSVGEAVGYLGLETVKTLVLTVGVFSQYQNSEMGTFSMDSLWQHSMHVASLAKRIARYERLELPHAEAAYAGGMLHDTGKLILAANFPDEYTGVMQYSRQNKLEIHLAEREQFGVNHADLGGYLLGLWGLPVPVVEAIALHHFPETAGFETISPLLLVYAANIMAHESETENQTAKAAFNDEFLTKAGLRERVNAWRDEITQS